jgi:hypothetical protein
MLRRTADLPYDGDVQATRPAPHAIVIKSRSAAGFLALCCACLKSSFGSARVVSRCDFGLVGCPSSEILRQEAA